MIEIGDYALLDVVGVQPFGVFLDWGRREHLLMPNREMTRDFRNDVRPGGQAVVHVFCDEQERPTASMHLHNFVDSDTSELRVNQAVDLLFFEHNDLGYRAIVDQRYAGVVYHSEVFTELSYGQRCKGYIKKVREDGKLDLMLFPSGVKGSADLGQQILDKLRESGGFLAITDKTDPQVIYEMFGVSKKKFKMALGGIFKRQLVQLHEDGVRLSK